MRLIIFLFLISILLPAVAETQRLLKPVHCDQTELVFKVISEQFNESPYWWAPAPTLSTSLVLTVNSLTGTWTLIEFTVNTACILAVGINSSSPWGTPI
jgi:hypothetical protein